MSQHEMAHGDALVFERVKLREIAKTFAVATPVLRIATFHSSSLSSLVASLPALVALRESFPGARITAYARAPYISLLNNFRAVDEAHARPTGGVASQAALMARLHAAEYDLAVSFSQGSNAMLLLWATRAPQRAGFTPSRLEAFLTARVEKQGPITIAHALELVAAAGAHTRGTQPHELLDVPHSTFEWIQNNIPLPCGEFLLVPFDSVRRSSKTARATETEEASQWQETLLSMRNSWPLVVCAPRAALWRETAKASAKFGMHIVAAPDALTLLALGRAARAVVGSKSGASELAVMDGRQVIYASPQELEAQTRYILGL